MTNVRLTIRGETYLTLETVAACYQCEIAWVEQIYGLGLLGSGENVEGHTAIPARMLERLAEIVRLVRHHGIDPTLVDLWLLEE
jgi:hypothetical protein